MDTAVVAMEITEPICASQTLQLIVAKGYDRPLSWELQSPYVHPSRYNYSPLKARSSSSVHIELNSTGECLDWEKYSFTAQRKVRIELAT